MPLIKKYFFVSKSFVGKLMDLQLEFHGPELQINLVFKKLWSQNRNLA